MTYLQQHLQQCANCPSPSTLAHCATGCCCINAAVINSNFRGYCCAGGSASARWEGHGPCGHCAPLAGGGGGGAPQGPDGACG